MNNSNCGIKRKKKQYLLNFFKPTMGFEPMIIKIIQLFKRSAFNHSAT